MASVASQLIEEVTAHAKNDSLEDAREICADGSYFPNNQRIYFSCHNDYNENMFVGSQSAHISAVLYNYRAKYL